MCFDTNDVFKGAVGDKISLSFCQKHSNKNIFITKFKGVMPFSGALTAL